MACQVFISVFACLSQKGTLSSCYWKEIFVAKAVAGKPRRTGTETPWINALLKTPVISNVEVSPSKYRLPQQLRFSKHLSADP